MTYSNAKLFLAGAVMALVLIGAMPGVNAQTRVSIGVTETMETFNPYGDSVTLLYGIWCEMYGCLGTYDFEKGDYVGILAERWETTDDPEELQLYACRCGSPKCRGTMLDREAVDVRKKRQRAAARKKAAAKKAGAVARKS